MTLSVLLGPFLNLSPAVPALANFTILGIATLDSFNLQGKDGTIFLDWIAGFSSEHRDGILLNKNISKSCHTFWRCLINCNDIQLHANTISHKPRFQIVVIY
jgi:hypothetical protein